MIPYSLFWFTIATLFAILEVENEGKFGWAEKTQTWFKSKKELPRIVSFFMGEKPFTGYHLVLFPLVVLITHAHFFMGVQWNIEEELKTIALYLLWTPLWDYLWFVYNPFYSLKNLKAAWWYKEEYLLFGLFPKSNVIQWILSIALVSISSLIFNKPELLLNQLGLVSLFIFYTLLSILCLAPVYKKLYKQIRNGNN